MSRNYQPWSRAEYDRLEELVAADWRIPCIAEEMGRSIVSIRGAIQRLGIGAARRHAWNLRKDWPEIDAELIDCIESRMMSVPKAAEWMRAQGRQVNAHALYKRLPYLPDETRRQARANARRSRVAVCDRMNMRRQRAA